MRSSVAQATKLGEAPQLQGACLLEAILERQSEDGMWYTGADSTYMTALCSLALLSELDSASVSKRQDELLRLRILKALDSVQKSSPKDDSSATSYLRALSLYYGWELLGLDKLRAASETAIRSLTTPTNTHAQLIATMFWLSVASREYARLHGTTPDKQTIIRTFDFLDRTLPSSFEQSLRLHIRTVIFWGGSPDRPIANLLPECWNMAVRMDSTQRADENIRSQALLLLTINTFSFRKIGPRAGMYRSLAYDGLQLEPATTVSEGSGPEIDLRGL